MSTLNLVSAIINKDTTSIEEAFNAVMAEKISTQLDNMHTAVAQSMFSAENIVSEDIISEEEYLNLSEEEQEEYDRIDTLSESEWTAEMPATKFSSADKNKSDALKKSSGKTNADALKKNSDAFAKKKSI